MNTKGNILVIDNEVNLCRILDARLTKSGYRVTAVHDAPPALEALQRQSYDIILLDLALPSLNGLEALKRIRAVDENVPVIVMTALESTDTIEKALSGGSLAWVRKPFDLERLVRLVQAVADGGETPPARPVPAEPSSLFHAGQRMRLYAGQADAAATVKERTASELLVDVGDTSGTLATALVPWQTVRVSIPLPDALYQFSTRVKETREDGQTSLEPPRLVCRVQRRAFPRVSCHALVQVNVGAREAADGRLEDVSAGGIRFLTKARLEPGMRVEVEAGRILSVQDFRRTGRVVRLESPSGTEPGWRSVAVEFTHPDGEIRRAIVQHLADERETGSLP